MEQSVSLPEELKPVMEMTWQKISELGNLLVTNDPKIAGHLKAIHSELIKYDELTHLLSDEQIREIVAAQSKVTGVVLVSKVMKESKGSITKQAKKISAEDL